MSNIFQRIQQLHFKYQKVKYKGRTQSRNQRSNNAKNSIINSQIIAQSWHQDIHLGESLIQEAVPESLTIKTKEQLDLETKRATLLLKKLENMRYAIKTKVDKSQLITNQIEMIETSLKCLQNLFVHDVCQDDFCDKCQNVQKVQEIRQAVSMIETKVENKNNSSTFLTSCHFIEEETRRN